MKLLNKINKTIITAICLAAVVLSAAALAGGFTGPGGEGRRVTAVDVQNLRDDTWVSLEGYIVRALGDEKYIFRDESGEVTVEIDDEDWRGLSVGENDRVIITGEVDAERLRPNEVDVKNIRLAR